MPIFCSHKKLKHLMKLNLPSITKYKYCSKVLICRKMRKINKLIILIYCFGRDVFRLKEKERKQAYVAYFP